MPRWDEVAQQSAQANMAHQGAPGDPRSPFGVPAGRIPVENRVDPGADTLVKINKYGLPPQKGDRVFQLASEALGAFQALRLKALAAGFDKELFTLASAYRGQPQQNGLKATANQEHGPKASGKWTAKLSEHITGRTFDLNLGLPNDAVYAIWGDFEGLPSYEWLKANAPDFGLNPYSTEPWHWTYNVKDQ